MKQSARWQAELCSKFTAEAAHAFLFYLNVNDDEVSDEGRFERLQDVLLRSTPVRDARMVVFFNRGTGIRFATKEMKEEFFQLFPFVDRNEFEQLKRGVNYAFGFFDELLCLSQGEAEERLKKDQRPITNLPSVSSATAEDAPDETEEFSSEKPFVAVILEYLETIVPPDAASSGTPDDRFALVALQWWAQDAKVKQNKNVVVCLASALSTVAPDLRDPTRGFIPIRLELPDLRERLEVVRVVSRDRSLRDGDAPPQQLAHLTAGLSRIGVRQLLQTALHDGASLTSEYVFSSKKKLLEEQSGGMLEIMQPIWPLDVIGGLEAHKKFILMVVRAMRESDVLKCPMGILLIGPPGTGKTIFAEVLASQAGIPLLKMKNIREMWVGQSERNLDLVLHLIELLAPAIVFIDEIDQEIKPRGTGYDNTGVNERMAARQFAFMSDTTLRGKVVWLAATNRPDLIDAALLREGRFDEKIPFLPPDVNERKSIFPALLQKMTIQAQRMGQEFRWEATEDDFRDLAFRSCRIVKEGERGERELRLPQPGENLAKFGAMNVVDFTGAEIETILLKAYQRYGGKGVLTAEQMRRGADNFLLTRSIRDFNEMTDLALLRTDSMDFVPPHWQQYAQRLRTQPRRQSDLLIG